MSHTRILIAALSVLALFTSAVPARDLFVSPQPAEGADGSRGKPLDLATALSARSPAAAGDTLVLLAGRYDAPRPDPAAAPAPFEVAVSGAPGQTVRILAEGAVVLNGAVVITGSHVDLVSLEIGDLGWDPLARGRGARPTVHVGPSRAVRLINCNLFGGYGGGVSAGAEAVDFEMYGCLVHDFGALQVASVPLDTADIRVVQGGAGDGFVGANREGVKRFEHNVFYRGCGGNVHLSTYTVGIEFIGNISYLSKGHKTNENMDSFPICGNYQSGAPLPMDRIRMVGNLAYQPVDISAWRPNMRLISYRGEVLNGSAEVKDNFVIGAAGGLEFTRWRQLELTGNTVWATERLVSLSPPKGAPPADELGGWTVDRNTWIANGNRNAFQHGFGEPTFEGWRKLGFDANGRLLEGRDGHPAGTRLFVFPNRHQPGRAHIGVFNFDGLDAVKADLGAVLQPGTVYRIYNTLDIRSAIGAARPAVEGVYDGGEVALPMKRSPVSPEFEAFLILPGGR